MQCFGFNSLHVRDKVLHFLFVHTLCLNNIFYRDLLDYTEAH